MAWSGGMPDGMSGLLIKKYQIMQQEADARTKGVDAEAKLALARAGVIPTESAANVANTQAQTGLIGEQAKYFGQTALAGIRNSDAQVKLYGAQGRNYDANTGLLGEQTTAARNLNKNWSFGESPAQRQLGIMGSNFGRSEGMFAGPVGGMLEKIYSQMRGGGLNY